MQETLTYLLSFVGGGAALLGVLKFIPSIIPNFFMEKYLQKNRISLEKTKNDYQSQLEKKKSDYTAALEIVKKEHSKEVDLYKTDLISLARYSESQFKLCSELWSSLFSLKIAARNLWENASEGNLREFSNQFYETEKIVGHSVLLLDDEHYQQLSKILITFGRFEIGKKILWLTEIEDYLIILTGLMYQV
jgi:hypothetical protein